MVAFQGKAGGMTAHADELAAERNGTVRRIIALESIATAALLGRKRPETIQRLQNEILSMRARVRLLDEAIKQSDV
jgi:hypothetical protein